MYAIYIQEVAIPEDALQPYLQLLDALSKAFARCVPGFCLR